jgi:FMN-dependent NADH-azoreductase
MPTLLQVDSSPRADRSISRQLTSAFAQAWLTNHPGGRVIRRDLRETPIPHLDDAWIAAARLPAAERDVAGQQLVALSDELVAELREADHYVFGVPMYNYTVPSTLKAYIDTVIRSGVTVAYSNGGLKSLLPSKIATAITASSGSFPAGTPRAEWDFLAPYLRKVLGLLASDVEVIVADGLSDIAQRDAIFERSHERIHLRAQIPGAAVPAR